MGLFDDLTIQQKAFVEAYTTSAPEAARALGISIAAAQGLLQEPAVRKAIRARFQQRLDPLIADRNERLAFWTEIMRDSNRDDNMRLRASELLGKANLDFGERKISEVKITSIVPKTELEERINQIVADDDWMS